MQYNYRTFTVRHIPQFTLGTDILNITSIKLHYTGNGKTEKV